MMFSEALPIGLTCDRSLYDCWYVASAIQSNPEGITADERLPNALAARTAAKWRGAIGSLGLRCPGLLAQDG